MTESGASGFSQTEVIEVSPSGPATRVFDLHASPTIRTLIDEHGADAATAALVHRYAKGHSIEFSLLDSHPTIRRALSVPPAASAAAQRWLREHPGAPSLTQLARAREAMFQDAERRQRGVTYTPRYIATYLLREAISLRDRPEPPTFCDPCCGAGVFLIEAATLLRSRFNVDPQLAFTSYLHGYDADPRAIEGSYLICELYLARHGIPGPATLNLTVADSLIGNGAGAARQAIPLGPFDLIATNPPYVKLQHLSPPYREALLRLYGDLLSGNFSLSLPFLLMGYESLTETGVAAFITQNNLFTSLAARKVRHFLKEHGALRRIVDFGHQRVFESVSAYTCLMFLGKPSGATFEYETMTTKKVGAKALCDAAFSTIPLRALDSTKWRLAKQPHLGNLHRIEGTGRRLGAVADISVGFATLKDAVFLVRRERDGWQTGVAGSGVDNRRIEGAFVRPIVKVSSVAHQADVDQQQLGVIFPYRRGENGWRLVDEAELRRAAPATMRFLEAHRALLARRDKGCGKYEGWYAWGRTQGRDAPGPKLLTKTFSHRPQFFLDETDRLFCNGYGVVPRRSDLFHRVSIRGLRILLNSAVMDYYATLTSFQIEGSYQCYQKNFIERFGVPSLDEVAENALAAKQGMAREEAIAKLYNIAVSDMEAVIDLGRYSV